MRKEDAGAYAAATQSLAPFGVNLAQALRLVGSLSAVLQAAEHWATEHRKLISKSVSEVVSDFVENKTRRDDTSISRWSKSKPDTCDSTGTRC